MERGIVTVFEQHFTPNTLVMTYGVSVMRLVSHIVPRFAHHNRLDDGVYAVQRKMQSGDIPVSKRLPLLCISDCVMVSDIDCLFISEQPTLMDGATAVYVFGDDALFEKTQKLYESSAVIHGTPLDEVHRIGFHGKHY